MVEGQEDCLEEETLGGGGAGKWGRRRGMGDTESLRWAEREGKETSGQQKGSEKALRTDRGLRSGRGHTEGQ